jgi:hypothetical protein
MLPASGKGCGKLRAVRVLLLALRLGVFGYDLAGADMTRHGLALRLKS